jgi:23S rRNA U2552 (ribose-2'-O)-methylase RlmE/FtsJ
MNFNEEITKKVNLTSNDGLSSYSGLASQQHHNVYEVFHNFLNDLKPKRILEIGTALGGFTQFLKKVSDELGLDIKIITYDIHEMSWYKDMIENGIDVRVENIFDNNYQSVNQEIIEFIQNDGTTLVLCDGGNKIGEFNILSNYIKQGDYIMAHDYIDTRENFIENFYGKIWNWHEISENDISESCDRNELKSYNKETFDSVVWVCKTK